MQQWYCTDANRHVVSGACLAGVWRSDDRGFTNTPLGLELCLALGGDLILYLRILVPGYRHASGITGAEQPISFEALFPDLCGSGTQWLQHGLLMDQLHGFTYIHVASVLDCPPTEGGVDLL